SVSALLSPSFLIPSSVLRQIPSPPFDLLHVSCLRYFRSFNNLAGQSRNLDQSFCRDKCHNIVASRVRHGERCECGIEGE
ncbi:hypothetical protein PanWU01x14_147770, partial [Parasponia andersonii]